jgi:aldose sugar dehydrogenase
MHDRKATMEMGRGSTPTGAAPACARPPAALLAGLLAACLSVASPPILAQALPTVADPDLEVRSVVGGLSQPVSMAFLKSDDFFVVEKASGQVKRYVRGQFRGVVLDLAVNSASERGLLDIALHPDFPRNPRVYLYWTESSTGADSGVLGEVPDLGNRVDRFLWNGSTLTQGRNIIRLRARQTDANQPERGNHNGGVIAFGPDEKLYIFIGDNGRRGWTQNLFFGPFGPGVPDDQLGGPAPDDAHLTGVVLRLNDDGSSPRDNPFARLSTRTVRRLLVSAGIDPDEELTEQVEANLGKIFGYGFRNSFGFDFEPKTGDLWLQENSDDAFTEINRVRPGLNGGWIQVMGPAERYQEFRTIEQTMFGSALQQVRWPPSLLAPTVEEAQFRLVMFPGAHYSDPEFSWKFEVAPAGMAFMRGRSLGREYEGNLFLGASRDAAPANTFNANGYLLRFKLTDNRRRIDVDDPRLEDRVADNVTKHEGTESESLVFGTGFGVGTDVQTGPSGNLYVVSLTRGTVFEIRRKPRPGRSGSDSGPG